MHQLTRRNVEIKLCYDHLTTVRGHRSKWALTLLEYVYFFKEERNYIYALIDSVTPEQMELFKNAKPSFNYHAIIGNKYDRLMEHLCIEDKPEPTATEKKLPTLFDQ